ncbi:MAG: hypothetical protein HYW49_13720 [Deltaproteobacteria bacterium]|nr:hypothetical protein [Deltaproteobacteria bacterium]
MEQSNKNVAAVAESSGEEGQEIDRIMKEIEDLESKIDEPVAETGAVNAPQDETAASAVGNTAGNVVPLRASDQYETSTKYEETMAETDAVAVQDEPLMRTESEGGNGNLSLKVGGCAEVQLEFTRAGITVTFQCSDTGLTIMTDQGAEFRIPFQDKAAA